jgi:hypothetical protein
MHWDVVEVKPEPDYRLLVRFRDGLAGHVQLVPAELSGVLAPLLNVEFFERVFIDSGAVAWPGDIDLAPDAMYAEVATSRLKQQDPDTIDFREQLPRFYELKDLLSDPSHPDACFQNFEDDLKDRVCFDVFALWERELHGLDPLAWDSLKAKAKNYLLKRDRRAWQQLFDVLGEAFAYNYLRTSVGCSQVCFIPESNSDKRPDIECTLDSIRVLCEVKTINISDKEIQARYSPPLVRKGDDKLRPEFFNKLDSHIAKAKSQLQSYDHNGSAQQRVFINVCFDDWAGIYKDDYLRQIEKHLVDLAPGVEVVVSAYPSKDRIRVTIQPSEYNDLVGGA